MPEHTPETFAAEVSRTLESIDSSGRGSSVRERVGQTVHRLTHDLPQNPEALKKALAQIVDAAVIHGEV